MDIPNQTTSIEDSTKELEEALESIDAEKDRLFTLLDLRQQQLGLARGLVQKTKELDQLRNAVNEVICGPLDRDLTPELHGVLEKWKLAKKKEEEENAIPF